MEKGSQMGLKDGKKEARWDWSMEKSGRKHAWHCTLKQVNITSLPYVKKSTVENNLSYHGFLITGVNVEKIFLS